MHFTIYYSIVCVVLSVSVDTISISSNVKLIYQSGDNSTSESDDRSESHLKDENQFSTNSPTDAAVPEVVKENDNVDETSGEVDESLDTGVSKSDLKCKETEARDKEESILNDNQGESIEETPGADFGSMMKGILQRLDDIISLGKCNAEKGKTNYPLPSCPKKSASLESNVPDLCNEISKLEVKIQLVADKIEQMAKTQSTAAPKLENVQISEGKGDNLDATIARLKDDIAKLSRSFAFSARRQGHVPGEGARSRLTSYTATINDDLWFNPLSGILTVPDRGLYMFTLSYHKVPLGVIKSFLVVDYETVATGEGSVQSTVTALVELRQGQEVWVEFSTSGVAGNDVTFTLSAFLVR